MNALIKNYYNLINNIKQTCNLLNKPIPLLLAVSKTHTTDKIIAIYDEGQRHFGENYAQELMSKAEELKHLNINWHYIGHIQSNKIKLIAQYASYVHGLCEIKHAIKLNEYAHKYKKTIKVLLEINLNHKENRNGLRELNELLSLVAQIKELSNLELIGLMGIASDTTDDDIIDHEFSYLSNIFNQLKSQYPTISTLSMGMSNDYKTAIKNDSTLIRIGSQIFGTRDYQK